MAVTFIDWKKKPKKPGGEKLETTSVSFDPKVLKRLKRIARRRADIEGGRTSVSGLLQVVVDAHIAAWEKRWPPSSSS